jgi:hypothetical protein
MKLRTCIKCNIDKQIDEFHPHGSGGLGGYDSRCKQCKSKACSIIYKLKKQFPKPKIHSEAGFVRTVTEALDVLVIISMVSKGLLNIYKQQKLLI